jgi:hypothetical protein
MAENDEQERSDRVFHKLLGMTVIVIAAMLWDTVFARQTFPGIVFVVGVVVLCFIFAAPRRRRR